MQPMQRDLLYSLIKKQLEGTISAEERQELALYVEQEGNKEQVVGVLADLLELQVPDGTYDGLRFDPVLHAVLQADREGATVIRMRKGVYKWLAIAAVLIVIAGGGLLFLYRTATTGVVKPQVATISHDAMPGGEGAILTLANGKEVLLDSTKTGVVEEGGMKAVVRDGMLVYEVRAAADAAVGMHKMATPRGRQFQVVLPDGTKVWLNAASSITYPMRFADSTRSVRITGEAYFEVVKNAAQPFVVSFRAGDKEGSVEVLGTHFNINTYGEGEDVTTTLLEGAVKVHTDTHTGLLKPGEQMVMSRSRLGRAVRADLEAVMAWKEGLFHFNNTRFAVVMGELERWYDVDVVYEHGVPPGSLSGEFPRTLLLSEVLRILELSGMNYRIENKKLILSAK
jgi:hypothetical protein